MELRHRRRAFVNGASVSAIRLQSLTHSILRTPPKGIVVYGLSASDDVGFAQVWLHSA